jgi:predicted RNA-binding Zn ribbon-like protein
MRRLAGPFPSTSISLASERPAIDRETLPRVGLYLSPANILTMVTQIIPMTLVNHSWIPRDIVGGNLALELVNTVSGWNSDPEDWVPDIASFLVWARTCGVLDEGEQNAAARRAKDSPAAAERVLASVKELRFALWRLVDSLERRKPPEPGDLSVLDEWRRRLAISEQIIVRRNKIEFTINRDISALELPGLRVTAAALSFLKNLPTARIKTCRARDCGWKFVDQSRNRSRRWCDMAVCGNLAKTRQYRARNG